MHLFGQTQLQQHVELVTATGQALYQKRTQRVEVIRVAQTALIATVVLWMRILL